MRVAWSALKAFFKKNLIFEMTVTNAAKTLRILANSVNGALAVTIGHAISITLSPLMDLFCLPAEFYLTVLGLLVPVLIIHHELG